MASSRGANNEEPGLSCIYCGANMTMYTSHTERNPNRKFWKCHTSKDSVKCRGFFWLDELERNSRRRHDGFERQLSEVNQSLKRFQECQEAMDEKICSIHRELGETTRCCCIL